jgi:hypothetical protein
LHLRRLRPAVWLRRLAASARSDNLIQRLNISSSALGASQKLAPRHKAMMLAALDVKEKGRLACSVSRCSFVINSPTFRHPMTTERRLRWAYPIDRGDLCTIGYILYNRVTKGHGRARIDNFIEPADVNFHLTRRSSVRFSLCSSVSSVVKGLETIPAHNRQLVFCYYRLSLL